MAARTSPFIGHKVFIVHGHDGDAWTEILALHQELDHAVADCYGWPISISQNAAELVRRLIALNAEIIKGTRSYDPFGEL